MNYNPYDNQFYDLVNEIEIKETRIKEIDDIINNHPTLKEELPKEISGLEQDITNLRDEIKSLSAEISNSDNDSESDSVFKSTVKAAGVLGGIALMALNTNPIVKTIAVAASIITGGVAANEVIQKQSKKENIKNLEINLLLLNNKLNDLIELKIEKSKKLEEVENYNLDAFNQEKNEILVSMQDTRIKLNDIKKEKIRIDNAIKNLTDELSSLLAEGANISLDIDTVEKLKAKLEKAASGYERKCIHDECERLFTESRPSKVLLSLKGRKKTIDKRIEKMIKRITEHVQVLTNNINLLVIDGNNLCYKNSNKDKKFIGIVALKALVKVLLESEFTNRSDILICFDSEITKLLKLTEKELENSFKNISNKIEIFISNGKADETIINAAENTGSYIISNDHFSDFFDKKAIKERRVFPYTIKYNAVYIEPLRLKADF